MQIEQREADSGLPGRLDLRDGVHPTLGQFGLEALCGEDCGQVTPLYRIIVRNQYLMIHEGARDDRFPCECGGFRPTLNQTPPNTGITLRYPARLLLKCYCAYKLWF